MPSARMRILLSTVLVTVLWSQTAWSQVRPTAQELRDLPIQWASIGLKPADAQRVIQRVLDPSARSGLLAEIRSDPNATSRTLAAMFNSLVSVMASSFPGRAPIAAGLSQIYGELAVQVRATPGMPVSPRVAFGRTYVRFLKDQTLVAELGRYGRARKLMAELAPIGGVQAGGAPGQIAWQVPAKVPASELVAGPTATVITNMGGFVDQIAASKEAYCKQANRCRIAERGHFSPPFVAKQRAALKKSEAEVKARVKSSVSSVPRLLEAEIYKAFVWPASGVRTDRLLANLGRVDLSTAKPLWDVNSRGLDLHRDGSVLHLDATFETNIDNPAVLNTVKSSIEELWRGDLGGPGRLQLRTTVNLRPLRAGEKFSDGSLRLVEGSKTCATASQMNVCRVFDYTAPAHEFAHVLGVRDGYRVFYDPKLRNFIHVQDRSTLMGSLKAPLGPRDMRSGLQNVTRRAQPRAR
jgi:hypothetical protein